jgi:cyclic pyranopterin phosphate synthase
VEPSERTIDERIVDQPERIHINTGAVCNNNCIFCMEEDRDGRYEQNSAITGDDVRQILDGSRGAEEVCFTSGEPTTNPLLPDYVAWARERGYRRISIMTNGRMLSQPPYTQKLLAAGMNRFYVSIHGHEQKLHEGLTRTPGSFAQTVRGIDVVRALGRAARVPIDLHTSTVLTHRNLPHLGAIYRFLRAHGVDQVVFNVMQANGRADTYFDQIFPKYSLIASHMRDFLANVGEDRPSAFLVDIPLCTTEGVADFNRGYVEKYSHYEIAERASLLVDRPDASHDGSHGGKGLVVLSREDLDNAERTKRPECASCVYNGQCEGVWKNYTKRYGWDEMVPVTRGN